MSQLIKKGDLELILAGAAALMTRELGGESVRKLLQFSEDSLPLSAIHEVAEDVLRIPREYIDAYLQTRFPSRETQIQTLKSIHGEPTIRSIIDTYRIELLNELDRVSPLENFGFKEKYIRDYSICGFFYRYILERGLFGKKKETQQMKLAEIELYGPPSTPSNSLRLQIDVPFFAGACKEKINELRNRFSQFNFKCVVKHNYPI